MSDLASAIAQMRAMGMPDFPPGHPQVGLGKITRYGPKKRAWYLLNEFRTKSGSFVVVGAFGLWGAIDSTKIEVDWKGISAEERADLERQQKAAEAAEREKRAERAHNAANRARQQWHAALMPAAAAGKGIASPYLERKQVDAEAVRFFTDGTMLVPMMVWSADKDSSRLVGLQKIAPDGTKRFTKNMAKDGASCRLGDPPKDGEPLILAEGYATGGSIRKAINRLHPVFLAFDAGNLLHVAQALRERYPASPILIAADDDWKTVINGQAVNVGLMKAMAVTKAVASTFMVAPLFPDAAARDDKWTDFNDLAIACGLETVGDQLRDALSVFTVAKILNPDLSYGADTPPGPDGAAGEAAEAAPEAAASGGGGGRKKPPKKGRPADADGDDLPPWHHLLQRNDKGAIKPTLHNAHLFLTRDTDWQGVLGYDQFAEAVVKLKPPPYDGGAIGEWTDLDDHRTLLWLSTRIGEPSGDAIAKVVTLAAHEAEFNPLRERLERLKWDNVPRLGRWIIDWCHALKSRRAMAKVGQALKNLETYLEWVGQRWMIGAVARVFEPGCQMDNMLIFESEGGWKKSSLFRALGGEWFTDARLNFMDKDSLLILQGRHIVEMAELEGMNKADASETKRFITHREDLFRPPYGRRLVKYPRRCVFAGTVNLGVYLKDDSGNRRFWPVETGGPVDIPAFKEVVDQLWAEAVQLYKEGERWWVEPHERAIFDEQQEERFIADPWEARIANYLDGVGDFAGVHISRLDEVTTGEILAKCLKFEPSRIDQNAERRVGRVMARMGWDRRRASTGRREWRYVRPEEPESAGLDASAGAINRFDALSDDLGGSDVPF